MTQATATADQDTEREHRTALLAAAVAEITRRGGETIITGKYGDTNLAIEDVDAGMVLVHATGWRSYGKQNPARIATLSYLHGTDDSGPWAVRVPGTVLTVRHAISWITPAEVADATAKGKRVWRQGDVYAIETTLASDGKGAGDVADAHVWNPKTRYLVHKPADGRKHRPLKLSRPVRFVSQRVYGMGRGAGRANGD